MHSMNIISALKSRWSFSPTLVKREDFFFISHVLFLCSPYLSPQVGMPSCIYQPLLLNPPLLILESAEKHVLSFSACSAKHFSIQA